VRGIYISDKEVRINFKTKEAGAMKATDELKKEHRAVKTAMAILDTICQRIEGEQSFETEHLDQLLEFIRVFTDTCHHGKEEDILFPALEAAGVPKEAGPIMVMLQEHETMRGYIRGFAEALDQYKDGDESAVDQIVENVRAYLQWLESHIDKEENILFSIADVHLDAEMQEALYQEFEELEEQRIGRGVHEQFHEVLHTLKDIYLENNTNNGETKLNASVIPPRERHPKIFQQFEALAPGESFILVNDHDPKPLFYQFQMEREGQFSWDYLQNGPEEWQVRIGKAEQV